MPVIYDDGEMRVLQKKGKTMEFIVYNYVKAHPDPEMVYGRSFFNQQLAQKFFQDVKASNNTIKKSALREK